MRGVPGSISFPTPTPHFAFVRKRWRNSGLTSVRWYDDETLYAADFSARTVYRVRPFSAQPIDTQVSTLDGAGQPTETDLMDLSGQSMVLTNFYRGEVAFYKVGPQMLRFERVIEPTPTLPAPRPRSSLLGLLRSPSRRIKPRRKIHGAVFVPGQPDLLWVSFCDAQNKGIEIVALDGTTVHSLATEEQAQDVAFIEEDGALYAVQAARTNHITVASPNDVDMYVSIYVYRVPADLRKAPPTLITSARFEGHLDALKSYRGSIYAANQHDSCVDQFTYSPSRNDITLARRFTGFDMPHGLDIRHDGLMAVTNYGPANDMRFLQLP